MAEIKTPIGEAVKEWLRLVLIAIIPVLIMGIDSTNGDIDVNWAMVFAVGAITLLRAIEKYLHEAGKKRGSNLQGLPF